MTKTLLELPTNTLLEKIGAGNHKPGSGSAAALNGILSCKLILTVIQLTKEPKRKTRYESTYAQCNKIQQEISSRIGPRLEELFQDDSIQFDKAITKRQERDKQTNQKLKNQLDIQAQKELQKSTELPIEIANLGLELANFSLYLIDNCFRSARGDSAVALSSALSSITGSISIINLNLQSFPKNVWTESIKKKRKKLKEEYRSLTTESFKRVDLLEEEAERKNELNAEIINLKKRHYGQTQITNRELEDLARDIQLTLWKYKDLIWSSKPPTNEIGLIKPKKIIKLLKYAYREVDTLGVTETNQEIGGIINNERDEILISKMYSQEVRTFTAAHEIGHALLHEGLELHRDKPISFQDQTVTRNYIEKQADKFAAYLLMPEKQIRKIFYQLFQIKQFRATEETVFALTGSSMSNFRKNIRNRRDLSRVIAKAEFFNFRPFVPLHKIFNVSIEAMAIRLEELSIT